LPSCACCQVDKSSTLVLLDSQMPPTKPTSISYAEFTRSKA
jgi:hypothetical protein